MSLYDDPDFIDIAEHPVDEAEYRLVWSGPHYGFEWERLVFRHRVTDAPIYRRREVKGA